MHLRPLGNTGILVSELGFGTWGIGHGMWGKTDDEESVQALQTAINAGVNFIDTALIYGDDLNHHSEKLIGQCLKNLPKDKKVYIATKIYPLNRQWPALPHIPIQEVFPKHWIYEAVETSLRNLGIQSIDLMQFHVWQDSFAQDQEWQDAVKDLTAQGKVKHWGISVNDYEPTNCLETLQTGLISTIQFIFNIFHQKPSEELLPFAKKYNVGLIARVPLDEGGLTGTITPTTQLTDWRKYYFRDQRIVQLQKRIETLRTLMPPEIETMTEMALRWVISHPEISTVIPGMRKRNHVFDNLKSIEKGPLSPHLMKELTKHGWERNFYW